MTSAELSVDRVVRERFFPNSNYAGVIIDVGAASPDFLSIGAGFREYQWRVISVEPNPYFCEMYRSQGYEIYQFACGDHDEDNVDFILVNSHGSPYMEGSVTYESLSSLGIKDSYAKTVTDIETETIKVKLRRLSTLLSGEINLDRPIDVLSVDVEGWELEVLAGLDLTRYRPRVMIVENLLHSKSYRTELKRYDYRLWKRLGLNDIYLDANVLGHGTDRIQTEVECYICALRQMAPTPLRRFWGRIRGRL